jgi:hypothetical protein
LVSVSSLVYKEKEKTSWSQIFSTDQI